MGKIGALVGWQWAGMGDTGAGYGVTGLRHECVGLAGLKSEWDDVGVGSGCNTGWGDIGMCQVIVDEKALEG